MARLPHWFLAHWFLVPCGLALGVLVLSLRGADRSGPPRGRGALHLQFERAWAGRTIDLVCHQRGSSGPGRSSLHWACPDWQLRPSVCADATLVVPEVPFGSWSLHAVAADEAAVRIASGAVELTDAGAAAVAMRDEPGAAPR
jgi:hypothetical protein